MIVNGKSVDTISSSQLFYNPDLPEASALRSWFDTGAKDIAVFSFSREPSLLFITPYIRAFDEWRSKFEVAAKSMSIFGDTTQRRQKKSEPCTQLFVNAAVSTSGDTRQKKGIAEIVSEGKVRSIFGGLSC